MPALPYSLNGANTRLVDDQYVSPLRLKDIEIKGIMNATGRRIGHPQVGISWCLLNHARDCPAVISSSRLNLINQLSLVPLSLLPLDTAD